MVLSEISSVGCLQTIGGCIVSLRGSDAPSCLIDLDVLLDQHLHAIYDVNARWESLD